MKMRIGARVMLWSAAIVLTVVAVVTGVSYYIARKGLRDAIRNHLDSVAQSRAAHVETFLAQQKEVIRTAATSVLLRDGLRKLRSGPGDSASAVRGLNAHLGLLFGLDATDVQEVFLLDRDGMVVASTLPERIGLDKSMDAYFVGAQRGAFIKDAYLSGTTGESVRAMSAPLFERPTGEFLGVLVGRCNMAALNAITTDRTGLGEAGETYLINKYGFMITPSRFRGDTSLKLKVDTANGRACLADMQAMRRGEIGKEHAHVSSIFPNYRGVRALGTHAHVHGMEWGLLAEIEADQAFAPIVRLKWAVLVAGMALAAFALLASNFFARRISRPIHELHVGSERIGAGQLDYRLEIRTGDEIEQLADEFNRMAAKLLQSHASLEQKVADRTAELSKEIEERERAEIELERYAADLERANREVRQFAYIVSHDLRAPLINLKGFAGELRSALDEVCSTTRALLSQLPEEQRRRLSRACDEDVPEALQFIESSVDRMDRFINSILKLSRMGHRELTLERINMDDLVRDILQDTAFQIEERGAKMKVGPLPEIMADRTSMEQIMGNLLSNAVKYLDPKRSGVIEITSECEPDRVTFHVRDNGRGIAASDMGKVFAPFRRAGKQDVEGEGMGLAYVHALVQRHAGGRIECESEEGVGSTFSFAIPTHPEQG